eukprot:CAMPEP_0184752290 /NCGR_PEP_ID=MMETSP0315-20130426/43497_1 /TAXON_ID=101924 /ORGANISM="Rhodosorus marinus, Strain UTEX LB 2760" /LENGTH=314 /DNA_ID=CAMNT_0027231611 /DNA_START=796 /DNA_END=1740 /DNA_ORIENTATION=+
MAARLIGRRSLSSLAIASSKEGLKATKLKTPEKLAASEVLVSFQACGESPFDKVADGSVVGSSGVALVKKLGAGVKNLKEGDRVIPTKPGLGTWREEGVLVSSDVAAIPESLKLEQAATLWSGPFTAHRILTDYKPQNAIIINGAETAAGQSLVQMASAKNLKSVCIVSAGLPSFAPVVEGLKYLGAEIVVDEDFPTASLEALIQDIGKIGLAVNISGAKSGKFIAKVVGGEKNTVTVEGQATGSNLGSAFSLIDWMSKASAAEKAKMIEDIAEMHVSGELITLSRTVPLSRLPAALDSIERMPLRTIVGIAGM